MIFFLLKPHQSLYSTLQSSFVLFKTLTPILILLPPPPLFFFLLFWSASYSHPLLTHYYYTTGWFVRALRVRHWVGLNWSRSWAWRKRLRRFWRWRNIIQNSERRWKKNCELFEEKIPHRRGPKNTFRYVFSTNISVCIRTCVCVWACVPFYVRAHLIICPCLYESVNVLVCLFMQVMTDWHHP